MYKAVVIVDLFGLSLSHTKPSALRLFQLLISKFQVRVRVRVRVRVS